MPRPVSQTSIRAAPGNRRQPTSTRPFSVYLSAFEIEVLHQPPHQPPVGANGETCRDEDEVEPLRPGEGGKLDFERSHQVADRDVGDLRPGRAGVEARNIKQRAENFLDRLERDIDVARQIRPLLDADLAPALGERARIEPRGVERLQDIVAGGGEETGLGKIGCIRLVLRPLEFGIEALQFRRALVDAEFEHLVGGLERFLDLNGLRHVGIGGDDAAVRQPRRAHFDHAVGGEQTQPVRLVVVEQARDPLGDEVLRVARPVGAAAGVEAHDLVKPHPVAQHRGRQIEQVREFAVPGGQREIGVEDRDALPGVIERVLQLIAARLDRGRSLVDELERRLARDGPGPQEQRQHLPRRRSADRRREQEFRVANELRAGLERGVVNEAALAHEARRRRDAPDAAPR